MSLGVVDAALPGGGLSAVVVVRDTLGVALDNGPQGQCCLVVEPDRCVQPTQPEALVCRAWVSSWTRVYSIDGLQVVPRTTRRAVRSS